MKRIASILLLMLLTFNWVGYRLVTAFMENAAGAALQASIEEEAYDETLLIEMRVPLNAPYYAGTAAGFEPMRGEITIDGKHFRYVKRKVENGELVLLCIPDEHKTRFQNARTDFFKLVNDLNHTEGSKDKHTGSSVKSISAEYFKETNNWSLTPVQAAAPVPAGFSQERAAPGFDHMPERPPQA